jgi:excisionase family DNA binding protein
MTQDTLLTIQQVMERLQIADETVYRYIRQGKLKAVRVGGLWRVSEKALQEVLEAGR